LKGKLVNIPVLGYQAGGNISLVFGIKYCGNANELRDWREGRERRYLLRLRGNRRTVSGSRGQLRWKLAKHILRSVEFDLFVEALQVSEKDTIFLESFRCSFYPP